VTPAKFIFEPEQSGQRRKPVWDSFIRFALPDRQRFLRAMPSEAIVQMNTLEPAPLEANADQPMYHRVSGARFHSACRLGYDGGGDFNTCRKGVTIRIMTPQCWNVHNPGWRRGSHVALPK